MAAMPKARGFGRLKRQTPGSKWFFYLDGQRVTTPYVEHKAAEIWRRKVLHEEGQGRNVGAENCLMSDLFDLVKESHKGTSQYDATKSRLKHLRKALGKIRVVALRPAQIDGYAEDRLDEIRILKDGTGRPTRPASVNRELELLRRALNLGKRHTPPLVAHAPFVEMLKVENIRTRRITHEEYQMLIEALRTPERYAAVIAYHTGWRLGVIRGLAWDQVDWEEMVIRRPIEEDGKKRVGTAPIYGDMQEALKACMEVESDYVIHRERRGRAGKQVVDISKAWQTATLSVGLAGFRFHDLRACAVSNLMSAGVSAYDAMQISGHKTDSMLRRYDIVDPKRLREIGKQVEESFGSRETETVQ